MRVSTASFLGMGLASFVVLAQPVSALAQGPQLTQGIFCSAEGTGVWAGRNAAFRYQSSLLAPGISLSSDSLTLYVDEETAAIFPLGLQSGTTGAYSGASELNSGVRVSASVGEDLSFRVVLTDWRNPGAVAVGRCEWNYGD